MSDPWHYYLAAIRAAYPTPPPDLRRYLETFDADSDVNRAARRRVFDALDTETQRRLQEIMQATEPQLFN